jgi:hypothetical protein
MSEVEKTTERLRSGLTVCRKGSFFCDFFCDKLLTTLTFIVTIELNYGNAYNFVPPVVFVHNKCIYMWQEERGRAAVSQA